MNAPRSPKSINRSTLSFCAAVLVLLILSGCSWSFLNSSQIPERIRNLWNNWLNRQPIELRLTLEDPKLLCHNKKYSTQYTSLYPTLPKPTPEMIKEQVEFLEREIGTLNKTLALDPTLDSRGRAYIKQQITQLTSQLGGTKAGAPSAFYTMKGETYAKGAKEGDEKAALVFTAKELEFKRQSLITLDEKSYKKFYTDVYKNGNAALKGINDLTCLESLTVPGAAPLPNKIPDVVGTIEYYREGDKMVPCTVGKHGASCSSTKTVLTPEKIAELTYSVEQGNTDEPLDLSYIQNLRKLRVFNGGAIIKALDRGLSIFHQWPKLKILDLSSVAEWSPEGERLDTGVILDYKCAKVASPVYNGTLYSGTNRLGDWGKGWASGDLIDLSPPHEGGCGPRVYHNDSVNFSEGDRDRIEKYQVCGSDLKSLKGLNLTKLILPNGQALLNIDAVQEMESLKYLVMRGVQNPIKFGTKFINPNPSFDPSKTNSTQSAFEQLLPMMKKLWPNLEYLDVSGSDITSAPFGNLTKLKKLYMDNIRREGIDFSFLYLLRDNLQEVSINKTVISKSYCDNIKTTLSKVKVTCIPVTSRQEDDLKLEQAAAAASKPVKEWEKHFMKPYPGGISNTFYKPYFRDETAEESQKRCGGKIGPCPKIEVPDGGYKINSGYSGKQVDIDYEGAIYDLIYGAIKIYWSAEGSWWERSKQVLRDTIAWYKHNYDPVWEKFRIGPFQTGKIYDSEAVRWKKWLDQCIKDNINCDQFPPHGVYKFSDFPPEAKREMQTLVMDLPKPMFDRIIAALQPPGSSGSQTIYACNYNVDINLWQWEYYAAMDIDSIIDTLNKFKLNAGSDEDGYTAATVRGKTLRYQVKAVREARRLLRGNAPALREIDVALGSFPPNFFLEYAKGHLLKLRSGSAPKIEGDQFVYQASPDEIAKKKKTIAPKKEISRSPQLLSPANGASVKDKVTFSWTIAPGLEQKPTKYYWHVEINGEEPPQLIPWFGVDNGTETSISYPSDKINNLNSGYWVWSVGAEYPEEGIYWSEPRALFYGDYEFGDFPPPMP